MAQREDLRARGVTEAWVKDLARNPKRVAAPPRPCLQTERLERIRTRSSLHQDQLREPLEIVGATTNGTSNSPSEAVQQATHVSRPLR